MVEKWSQNGQKMVQKAFSERSPRPSRPGAAPGATLGASWGALGQPLAPQVALLGGFFFFRRRLGRLLGPSWRRPGPPGQAHESANQALAAARATF